MKRLITYLNEWKYNGNVDIEAPIEILYYPSTYKELKEIIKEKYADNYKILDLRDVDVSQVTAFGMSGKEQEGLFQYLHNVEEINIRGWNTSNVKKMTCMFDGCKSLKTIKGIESIDTSNVRDFSNMFYNCVSLESINVSKWNTVKVGTTSEMFSGCEKLIHIDGIENWNVKKLRYAYRMFSGCRKMKKINLTNFKNAPLETMIYMFSDCQSLVEIRGIESWDLSSVKHMNYMFLDVFNDSIIPSWYDKEKWDNNNWYYQN